MNSGELAPVMSTWTNASAVVAMMSSLSSPGENVSGELSDLVVRVAAGSMRSSTVATVSCCGVAGGGVEPDSEEEASVRGTRSYAGTGLGVYREPDRSELLSIDELGDEAFWW